MSATADFAHADVDQGTICWTSESSAVDRALEGKPQAGGVDRVRRGLRRIYDLDEVQSHLHRVAQVFKRDRRLLEGHQPRRWSCRRGWGRCR